MNKELHVTRLPGVIAKAGRSQIMGVLKLGDKYEPFWVTCFQASPTRWPQEGENVDVLLNAEGVIVLVVPREA